MPRIQHQCDSFDQQKLVLIDLLSNCAPQAYGVYGPPAEPHVAHLAFSANGLSLVTADLRPDAGMCGSVEVCLKFWDQVGTWAWLCGC